MKPTIIIAASLLGAAEICSAGPASNDKANLGGFTIQTRRSLVKPYGPLAYHRAFVKYRRTPPSALKKIVENHRKGIPNGNEGLPTATKAVDERAEPTTPAFTSEKIFGRDAVYVASKGSVVVTPESYDSEYLANIQIGTPAQTLTMDFDTGSSDLWVFSTELPSADQTGHTLYTPGKSSTSKLLSGQSWSITYGDGSSSSGNVYSDKVVIGGVSVPSQAVEAAQAVSDSFVSDTDNDGLVGLAFSSLNTVSPNQQTTFFDSAAPNLASRVFTADLRHNTNGLYSFGFVNSSAYTGSITYSAVDNSSGFWEFTSPGYEVGYKGFVKGSLTGIVDTGTTLLLLPDSLCSNYYSCVTGAVNSASQGGWVFPCSSRLPNLSIFIGSKSHAFTIPGTYMNYAPLDSAGTNCYGGLQSDSGIGFSIFGDIFIKAGFIVFDSAKLRLGFASKTLTT